MTNEEAIAVLTRMPISTISKFEECQEAISIAIKALELQTPKKPMVDVVEWISQPVECQCPICGRYVSRYDAWARATLKEHHCKCGQAIDWSEEND